jgi:hypothetical protein
LKKFLFTLGVLFFTLPQVGFALENHTSVVVTASSLPEFQLSGIEKLVFPTKDLALSFRGDISPIHVLATTAAQWSPLAFFNISGGLQCGTGWNYTLFGSRVSGLGIHTYNPDKKPHDFAAGHGADSLYWTGYLGATLQFDAAALWPGAWLHIVALAYNEISFLQDTKAHNSDVWYWMGSSRPNENSFAYYFSGLLGYRMPLLLNMAGMMFQVFQPLYNPQAGKSVTKLGPEETVSLAGNLQFRPDLGLMVLLQFMNKPRSPLIGSPTKADFARKWGFYRVAGVLTWQVN